MKDLCRGMVWMSVWVLLAGGCGAPEPVVVPLPYEADLAKAIDLLERGDVDGALPLLVHAVEQAPSNAVVWVNLGIAYADANRPSQSLAAFAQAAALDEDDARALELAAQLHMKAQEWDAARQLLDRANRRHEYSPRILTAMGVVEYRAGQIGLAEAFFSQALQTDEAYASALYNAGVLQRDGREDVERAVGYFEAYLAQAGEDDPRLDAVQAFVDANRMAPVPSAPTPVAPPAAPVLAPPPVMPVAVDEPEQPAPPVHPAHVTKALALADKAIGRKAYDEALVTLKQALKSGEDPDVLWRLAEVYGTHLGIDSKAQAVYKRFAAAYPADPRVARIPEAKQDGAPVTPDGPAALKNPANEIWTRALKAQKQGDTARAMVLYKAALKENPDMFGAWHNLGLVAKTEGDLPTAQQAFEKALALRKNWPDSLFMLAVVLHMRGDDDRAAERLDRLLVLKPNHVKAHYLLGVMYANAKRRVLARTHFEHVRRLDGDGEFGLQAHDWLKENERKPPPGPRR